MLPTTVAGSLARAMSDAKWKRAAARANPRAVLRGVRRRVGAARQNRAEHAAGSLKISVIVPVYNVESYLDECLDSIRDQFHRNLEILVIDDGSSDGSAAIAERHAAEDDRIRVVSQTNAGLGAARNAGVERATGDYLTFLDSDDILPPRAISRMVAAAANTGSDIVVGVLVRFNANRRWRPDWAQSLHGTDRLGISVTDLPGIVRNNYSCGKLFSAAFWRESGLSFREGVSYEDQPLVTQLYCRAKAIDVLTTTTYLWRQRGDLSSISQQTHSLSDLRDRIAAWEISHDVLSTEAPASVYDAWLATLWNSHFHWYLRSRSVSDDVYWAEIQAAVSRLTEGTSDAVLHEVEPHNRVAVELVRRGLRDKFSFYRWANGYLLQKVPTELTPEGLLFKLPTFDEDDLDIPADAYRQSVEQIPLVHRLDRAEWTPAGDLLVHGWAFFQFVDLADEETKITLALVDDKTGERREVVASATDERTPLPPSDDTWASYDGAAFAAELPVHDMLARRSLGPGDSLSVHVRVETGPLSRTIAVTTVHPGGSAGQLPPLQHDGGFVHRSDLGDERTYRLLYLPRRVTAEDLRLDGATLSGRLRGDGDKIESLRLVDVDTGHAHPSPVTDTASGDVEFSVAVPTTPPREPATATVWSLRAKLASGAVALVTPLAGSIDRVTGKQGETTLVVKQSHRGAVVVSVGQTSVEFDQMTVVDNNALIIGHVSGATSGQLSLRFDSRRTTSVSTVVAVDDGAFEAVLPLVHDVGRFGSHPLPATAFTVEFLLSLPTGEEIAGNVLVGSQLMSTLPKFFEHGALALTLVRAFDGALQANLITPIGAESRGRYRAGVLERTWADVSPERLDGVLIETNFGEIAGCNGAAVHDELRRRGADIVISWVVRDHSVVVPEGGIAVVKNSPDWFRALRTSKYLIENMYQPAFHKKPPGQVIVQTFHGYPFKVMGAPHWGRMAFSDTKIRSMDERAAEWDFLVSPARYATPLLTRDFRYDGPVLEIGYPRNDILVSAEAPDIRTSVREHLGIGEDQKVVLYAPTFRDYLSVDDHTAPIVDFLDTEALSRQLGESTVILIRGHAFNARTPQRPHSGARILDVTDYPEPADLYLAADVAVLDYSSLRFDFGVTGKPMLFLVPDVELYRESRGWLIDYEPTAPGPLLKTTAEVADALLDLDGVVRDYKAAYEQFRRDYLDLEDGRASARLVDAVFVPRGDAPPAG